MILSRDSSGTNFEHRTRTKAGTDCITDGLRGEKFSFQMFENDHLTLAAKMLLN